MKLRLVVDQIENGVVVPEQAVSETQAGSVVYIVDQAGKVAIQRVEAAQTYEGLRVITNGLEAGVPVIVEGLQLIRPGVSVKTEPAVLARPIRQATAGQEHAAKTSAKPESKHSDSRGRAKRPAPGQSKPKDAAAPK